ncbi:MAG: hypothetical protein IJ343_15300 [Clostridia bacterium]|nr:hypothetical protein [Clostridia bacterium]
MKTRIIAALMVLLLALAGLTAYAETIDDRGEFLNYIMKIGQEKPSEVEMPPCTFLDSYTYMSECMDMLQRVGAQQFSYGRNFESGTVKFSKIQWSQYKMYYCATEAEIIEALKKAKESGQKTFEIYGAKGVAELMFEDDGARLAYMFYQAGYTVETEYGSKRDLMIRVTSPVYNTLPWRYVETEDDVILALQDMYRAGYQKFVLVYSKELQQGYRRDRDYFAGLGDRALVTEWSYSIYSGARVLIYDKLVCDPSVKRIPQGEKAPEIEYLETMEQVSGAIREAVMSGKREVVLNCTQELGEALFAPAGGKYGNPEVIHMLAHNEGMLYADTEYSGSFKRIRLHNTTISPAFRILNGAEKLSTREKRLLSVAQEIVQGIDAETDGGFLWAVQEELTKRLTYRIDGSTTDDDCAYSLLTGYANCDGYADAFNLCAGLAGYETVMYSGDSAESSVGHAWSGVKLNGSWYTVDATWADQDGYVSPFCFLLGRDRAKEEYIWPEECFPLLAPTGLSGQTPYAELDVESMDELRQIMLSGDRPLGDVWVRIPSMKRPLSGSDEETMQTIRRRTDYEEVLIGDGWIIFQK